MPPFLLKYPLWTWRWMGQVRCPVVLIHGTADEVVPFADGERLAASVSAPLRFHPVAGGGHNDLAGFPGYWAAIDEALGAGRAGVAS